MGAAMTKRSRIQQQRLAELEAEFRELLPVCLRECARGRWGLFGRNDQFEDYRWWYWAEAEHLKDIATQILSIQNTVGGRNEIGERFLELCSLKGSNVPGEPKLAAAFLRDIEAVR
jgi:hypothetical protein